MSYFDLLKLAAPETIVVMTALVVLLVDLVAMRGVETALPLHHRRHGRLRRLRGARSSGC